MEGGAPKGRRLDGGSGMKEREGNRLKCAIIREHPSAADAVPLPQWGKAEIRGYRFSRIVKANTGYMEKKNNDGQSLPRVGKVASKASRIGF